jgi:protein gp37
VPFFFKQWGEWGEIGPEDTVQCAIDRSGRIVENCYDADAYPAGSESADGWHLMYRVGKKRAGRELDGRIHDEYPDSAKSLR